MYGLMEISILEIGLIMLFTDKVSTSGTMAESTVDIGRTT